MPLFMLMTKLAPEAIHDAEGRRSTGKHWLEKVRASCPEVKFVSHYAILGPYDFILQAQTTSVCHAGCGDRPQGILDLQIRRRAERGELAGSSV